MLMRLKDMRVMLDVQLPGTYVRMPCVFCHFATEVQDEFEPSPQAVMQAGARIDDVFVFSSATAPRVQYRVRCLGMTTTPDETSAPITLFHVYIDIGRTLATQLFDSMKACGEWSLLVSFDDDENIINFRVSTEGEIAGRSLVKRDTLDFMSPVSVRAN